MMIGAGILRTPLPKGFLAGGINCGVRNYRPDLGIIISEQPATGVGVFTQSTSKAAAVLYCEKVLPATDITNSGQANAATGAQGVTDNLVMAESVAKQLNCHAKQVLTASTGVIGQPLAIDKIAAAIPELVKNVSTIAEKFAVSILTTDLVPKTVMQEVVLSNGKVSITGICKGSGMIHPNMATMLGYILTDAKLTTAQAQNLLTQAVNKSFNMISVDGETSTNDSVFLLANGASDVVVQSDEDFKLLQDAITNVSITLAKAIARDGEGATKLIEVNVKGAPNKPFAIEIARALTVSPLVKTAIYGESPNWGRIMAKLGALQVSMSLLEKSSIHFQDHVVFQDNQTKCVDLSSLKESMKNDTIHIVVDFNSGTDDATAWGCDLSEKYVKINAGYLS